MSAHSRSSRRRHARLAALAAALAAPASARAACELRVEPTIEPVLLEYLVFEVEEAVATTALRVRNDGDAPCETIITIKDQNEGLPPFLIPGADLLMEVIAPDLTRAENDQGWLGNFVAVIEPGVERVIDLDFRIDQTSAAQAGEYGRTLVATVELSSGGMTNAPSDGLLFDVVVSVPPRAELNVAGADGTFGAETFSDTLTFPDAKVGDTRRVFVQSRSNAPARLTMTSDHGGEMRHETAAAHIAYTVTIGGQTVDLTEPYVVSDIQATGLLGRSDPLDIAITDIPQRFAGRYEDRIVLTIEPY